MKNQKNDKKQQSKINHQYQGKRIWKITAIAVIVVFALLMAGSLIKVYYFRSSFIQPTQAQIDYATKIATEKLKSSGGNLSMFQIHVGSRMRRSHEDGGNITILQVSFINNATSHIFLIDVISGKILLHSETEIYGTWAEHKTYNKHNFMHPTMRNER